MKENRKFLAGILVIVGLLIFAFAASNIFRDASLALEMTSCGEDCPHEEQVVFLTELIPLLVGFGVMAGAGTFYFMSQRITVKESLLKKNTEILLRFFNKDERIVINRLIENNGKVLQAEITRLPGLSKVRSHRIIKRLIERGVLEKEDYGKTNMIRFTKEVREGLF
ncbi:MAG: hypothetical protein KKA90_04190 [Nanoarchaeota archaeon]|nr:hypothetical protein [Nanoarchaeota archaeon]